MLKRKVLSVPKGGIQLISLSPLDASRDSDIGVFSLPSNMNQQDLLLVCCYTGPYLSMTSVEKYIRDPSCL